MPLRFFEWLSMTFLASFLKIETLVMENYCPASKIHPTSFKVILRKSGNVLSFAALACTQAVAGEHFGGD